MRHRCRERRLPSESPGRAQGHLSEEEAISLALIVRAAIVPREGSPSESTPQQRDSQLTGLICPGKPRRLPRAARPMGCRWKTLFMIFHSPSTLSSVNRLVNRWPVQLSSSNRTVAIVSMMSMLAIRAWSPVAGPFWLFQSKSFWIGMATGLLRAGSAGLRGRTPGAVGAAEGAVV